MTLTRDLILPHGNVRTPNFLPDATRGVVRAIDSRDLAECGIDAVMMNVFHLMRTPGSSTVKSLGGLHTLSAWERPIFTDSGGFQAYSLIRENPKYGRVSDNGIILWPEGSSRKFLLSPEKTVQLQLAYDSDLVICLDECTHPDDSLDIQERSVERTLRWARQCRNQFDRSLMQMKREGPRPFLMAVVQGGKSRELRRRCAEGLLEIGFDCFGYGGWPLDAENKLLQEVIAYTRELIPSEYPMHALGVGHPLFILQCVADGYDLFDSALPTRDARRGRLYRHWPISASILDDNSWFEFLYLQDKKHIKERGPVTLGCDCLCCRQFSLGYLHHLFVIEDPLALRLATIHNLRFMARLMEVFRQT